MTHLSAIQPSRNVPKPAATVKKIFIAGVGAVGSTLLKQISTLRNNSSLRVLGICNSRHVLWYDHSKSDYSLNDLLRSPEIQWNSVIEKLISYETGSVIFVDATGSASITRYYPELFRSGIHVVTPSKLANTQTQQQYDELHQLAKENDVQFLYETNVGAGLPIIGTIKDLIDTGDEVLEIDGVLSGTMTYLFSELDKGNSFSKTVIQARTLGYAEPDPRDDLSGEDVARKFMILARICGLQIERDELEVESMVPEPLQNVDAAAFLENLSEFDSEWSERLAAENASGNTLRYTGTLKNGTINVGVKSVPKTSAMGQLKGTNNIIRIKTKRYNSQPIIIQGPGAGKEVTASGVLGDILKIR